MNKETLNLVLKENNVDEAMYDLNGGLPNEKYCINYNTTFWEVYYSERGVKSNLKIFETEDSACKYLVSLLVKRNTL